MKTLLASLAVLLVAGCGMSEQEVREKAGDAAVAGKRAIDSAGEALKKGYDTAAEKGKEVAMKAGDKWDEAVIKGKMAAAFRLIADLDASGVVVEVKGEKLHLSGTVPTELDKMKVEGAAYGVMGSRDKFVSSVTVRGK